MSKMLTGRQVAAKQVKDAGYPLWVFIAIVMVLTSYIAVVRDSSWAIPMAVCGFVLNLFLFLALLGERHEFRRWLSIYRGGML